MKEIVTKGNNTYIVNSQEQLEIFLSNGWSIKQEPTPPAEAPAEPKVRIKRKQK